MHFGGGMAVGHWYFKLAPIWMPAFILETEPFVSWYLWLGDFMKYFFSLHEPHTLGDVSGRGDT